MRRFSLLDAICGVVLSQRSQRNCIMTDSLRSHKNGNAKRLPAGDVSSGKLWIVLRRAYHSVVGFLESGITARGVALSDFVVLEVILHKGDFTAAEIAKKTRLAAASVEITIARLKEQNLIRLRFRSGKRPDNHIFGLTEQGRGLSAWLIQEQERDNVTIFIMVTIRRR